MIISQLSFVEAIGKVLYAVPSRSSIEVLCCIKMSVTDGALFLSATDLDVYVTAYAEVEGDNFGPIAVSAKDLYQIVSKLKGDVIVEVNDNTLSISTDNGFKAGIVGMDYTMFPHEPVIEAWVAEYEVDKSTFAVAMKKSSFATSNDTSRGALTAVNVTIEEGGQAVAVATDGHRLGLTGFDIKGSGSSILLLNKKAVQNAFKTFCDSVVLSLRTSNAYTVLASPEASIWIKSISAPYPDYNKGIPKEFGQTITINKEALADALKVVASVVPKSPPMVRLVWKDGSVEVCGKNTSTGASASQSVECEGVVSDITMGFNAGFLIEVLSIIEEESVVFSLNGPVSAVVIKGVGNEKDLFLIMPLRIFD